MTEVLVVCMPDTDLATAARQMHEHRCGVLPVIGSDKTVVGILTDRDIAVALGKADVKPSNLLTRVAMSAPVRTCRASNTVHHVLSEMKKSRIRRLPVVGEGGILVGMISVDDVILATRHTGERGSPVSSEETLAALEAICDRSRPSEVRK